MWTTASNSLTEFERSVGMLLGVVFIAALFLIIFLGVAIPRKAKRERQQLLDARGILETSNAHHLEGLPIAEKTYCQLNLHDDWLVIDGGGVNFSLAIHQITAIEVKTDVEIANIVHSSAAKGIVGGLLFGSIGLVVGSRATNKEKRTLHYYLIINYINSSGEIAAMLFADDATPHLTSRLVAKIQPLLIGKQAQTVRL